MKDALGIYKCKYHVVLETIVKLLIYHHIIQMLIACLPDMLHII